ncbi:VanW family protein [Streptosporangiaceae bacterium NEAU-GS5]|nr:VanW family protein [Streptosporangiaceae bacterium NEAU-GS5]
MLNAGASIDPPTDPFAAASTVSPASSPTSHRHPVRPISGTLPPGVVADIYGDADPPRVPVGPLPPASPAKPWPKQIRPVREEPPPPELSSLEPPSGDGFGRRYIIIAGVLLLFLGYVAPATYMSGKILPGTSVLGVGIGGKNAAEAAIQLRAALSVQIRTAVIVKYGAVRRTLDPALAGLDLNERATVARAVTGFPSPIEVWQSILGTREIAPVVSVDDTKLSAAIRSELGPAFDQPKQEGGIRFRGTVPERIKPKDGLVIDTPRMADRIRQAYLSSDVMVDVVLKPDVAEVPIDEVNDKVRWAKRAVSEPLTLVSGSRTAQLTPRMIASSLSFESDGGVLRPVFDAERAIAFVGRQLLDPDKAARDASFAILQGRPVLIPGQSGQAVDTRSLATDVVKALDSGERTVPVTLTNGPPRISETEARGMGIKEEIGSYSVAFPCCQATGDNIERIAADVDGYLIRPGETFSLNEFTGRRDSSRGYAGPVNTTSVRGKAGSDVPGISVFATAMFNAVLLAGMPQPEHASHDTRLPVYPAGREVAVSFPQPDLRWENDSANGVLIHATATDTSVTVSLWGTKRFDEVTMGEVELTQQVAPPEQKQKGADCVPDAGAPGVTARVNRIIRHNGKSVTTPVITVYAPRAAVVCDDQTSSANPDPFSVNQ